MLLNAVAKPVMAPVSLCFKVFFNKFFFVSLSLYFSSLPLTVLDFRFSLLASPVLLAVLLSLVVG
jgi:hypothetical protein